MSCQTLFKGTAEAAEEGDGGREGSLLTQLSPSGAKLAGGWETAAPSGARGPHPAAVSRLQGGSLMA